MEKLQNQPKYLFKVLWSKTNLGIAINEEYNYLYEIPITTFYFWPREDGWKLLKENLDSKPWVEKEEKIKILNGYTKIVEYWLMNTNRNITKENLKFKDSDLDIAILAIN